MPVPVEAFEIEAIGAFDGVGNAVIYQRGCTIARLGVGQYSVTLERALGGQPGVNLRWSVFAFPRGGAANANAQTSSPTTFVKQVNTFVGAVATDMAFDVMIVSIQGLQ